MQLEAVLDEGGPLLVDGLPPFVTDTAVALVGTAEKVWVPGSHHALMPLSCRTLQHLGRPEALPMQQHQVFGM